MALELLQFWNEVARMTRFAMTIVDAKMRIEGIQLGVRNARLTAY
jgi:hypothetical protein